MPSDNQDAYKKMYEMGKELMEMAKMGGYDPEAETAPEPTQEAAMGEGGEAESPNKVSTALSFLKG